LVQFSTNQLHGTIPTLHLEYGWTNVETFGLFENPQLKGDGIVVTFDVIVFVATTIVIGSNEYHNIQRNNNIHMFLLHPLLLNWEYPKLTVHEYIIPVSNGEIAISKTTNAYQLIPGK
jgi:hypothetical protein